MKAAFLFDTFLLKNENNDYYGMTLTYDFFKNRYLKYYDEIVVSTRVKYIKDESGNIDGYKIVNGDGVIVKPINSYLKITDGILKRKFIEDEIISSISDCDIVIIRLPSMIGNIACDLCRKIKKKYLVEMVACAWDGYINHVKNAGKIVAPYMYYYTRKNIKSAPKVLYVTNEFLQKRYPTKGESVACSDVLLPKLEQSILDNRLDKIERYNEYSEIKLCTVANVGLKSKGHEYVFKALAKLKNNEKKYTYYLVGNGDNTRLKKIISKYNLEENIVFLGSLSHDKVFEILDEIDIYIQPSLQEGLPRALLEAMSRACPAIGSKTGGIPELLNSDVIFKKKDYKCLANILEKFDINELKCRAKENFNTIKNFDLKKLEEIRYKFYK